MRASLMRILIVDDEGALRRALLRDLKPRLAGATFEDFGDGPSAVARAAEAPFDAALLDIRMPDMDGFQVAEKLLAAAPNTRIAFLTAELDVDVLARAKRISGREPFAKPWQMPALLAFLG